MSWRDRVAEEVRAKARRRLVRELCRAIAAGLTERDVVELLEISKAHEKGPASR